MTVIWAIFFIVMVLMEIRTYRVKRYLEDHSTRQGSYATEWYYRVVNEKEERKKQGSQWDL